MQRDSPDPGPLEEYLREWASYIWEKRPRPPNKRKKKELPLDEGEFVYNGQTKKWEKK